jgi:hypothetical protein
MNISIQKGVQLPIQMLLGTSVQWINLYITLVAGKSLKSLEQ